MFHRMSASNLPAMIEPNKFNLKGSDASSSLSDRIPLSLMRSGSWPVPSYSLKVKKLGSVNSKTNLTEPTARVSALMELYCS